ncbi:DUF1819 family protein [Saccharicrinis sp. GN24d3]|uniref:DUF1819 family protein n=1 Tax=Saccharicrinis sp. GN24d3 TaxID=3458416 RepID=UPI0040365AE6
MGYNEKYDFSYTASSLRNNEMILVARSKESSQELDIDKELGGGKSATGKRIFRECKKRLKRLTKEQVSFLLETDLTSQRQISFLAICKLHGFIRDFAVEVLREKLLIFDYDLTDGEYISFYRTKAELHPEMDALTASTQKKIKQVTMKILEQVGLIDNVRNKRIQPQLLDSKLIEVIAKDDKEWLKVFLLSDDDIANWTI